MELRTAQLIRRTAKANIERCESEMTSEERKRAKQVTARMMLTYAVLNVTVADIKFEFDECNRYRHNEKRIINEVEGIINTLFNGLRRHLQSADIKVMRSYDNWQTSASVAVSDAVLLEAPERSVNIALACCRLLIADNESLGRWCIKEVLPLPHIVRKLERLGINDYRIDQIVERTIAPMV